MNQYKELDKDKVFELFDYKPHKFQEKIHRSTARFKTIPAGRRSGKSKSCAFEILCKMLYPEQRIWIVAPNYELSNKVFREIYWVLVNKFPKWIEKESTSNLYLRLINGSEVIGKSADNPISLVGEGLDYLVMDECAAIPELIWTEALRPTLADRNGEATFIGTSKGRNWFQRMYLRGLDPNEKDYASWTFKTEDNPYIPKKEIEEARLRLPERTFKQEWEAAFIDDVGGVFKEVRKCIAGKLTDPVKDRQYIGGVDLAKHVDFTVILIVDAETKQLVYFERFNQIDWGLQKKRIQAASEKYNKAQMFVDSRGVGDGIFDDLVNMGVNCRPYNITSNMVKKELIDNLSIGIQNKEVKFPDIPELVNELEIFEYKETSKGSGMYKYSAPEGFHDDCVLALAFAWYGIGHRGTFKLLEGTEELFG